MPDDILVSCKVYFFVDHERVNRHLEWVHWHMNRSIFVLNGSICVLNGSISVLNVILIGSSSLMWCDTDATSDGHQS